MNKLEMLTEVIKEHRSVRLLEDGIYTVLDEADCGSQYEKKAALYDLVVGSRLYNRVIWGASLRNYHHFAYDAVKSHPNRWMLDAGCGSLLFTSRSYIASKRFIIACDQSLDMLRRARKRIAKLQGPSPDYIVLVQANLDDVPFRQGSFQTILSMNVLHHYQDAASLIIKLRNLLTSDGQLYLTSLVKNNRLIGDEYLAFLYSKGWFVKPLKNVELRKLLQDSSNSSMSFWTEGNMAYATISFPS